ncbi:hypothetical protein PO909_034002 [Leuciscus waleckii]
MEHLEPRCSLPSRTYISETALPELYSRVSSHVADQLKDVQSFSFTTDIWSSDVCPMSLLSLKEPYVTHWLNDSYDLQSAVLHIKEMRGSHTSRAISDSIKEMFDGWKIPISKVHVILRDNASNMKKAMDDLGVPSLGCVAHSLQLAVNEELLSQQSSILEQKRTLCAFAADHELPAMLTVNHWALLEKTMIVLSPFEELTRTISSSSSTTADVIPTVSVLKCLLSQERDRHRD